jgi:hypothetical protein
MGGFVVAWDADIDVFDWRVGIAKGDNWDVDITSLSDSLVINSWIGNDNQSWFPETGLGVIGETTWGESTVHRGSLNELGAFDGGSLSNIFGGNDANIGGVIDGGDDSSGESDLLPHLGDVENVGTGAGPFEHVLVHLVVAVIATEVHFSR